MTPPLVRHPFTLNSILRYGFATMIMALAAAIQLIIVQKTGIANVGLFYPMAFLIAWYFGFGPSFFSILIGSLSAPYLFYQPQFTWQIREPGDYFRIAVFFVTSTVVARIIDRGKRAELRLRENLIQYRSASRELRALQRRFDQVARAAHLGIWYTDLPLRKGANTWNEEMKHHAWIEPGESLEDFDFYSFIHPDDRERIREEVNRSIKTGEALDAEYRSVRPGHPDQVKVIHTYGWIDRDAHGVPRHFDGFALDVTREKKIQEELEKSRDAQTRTADLLRLITDQIPAFIAYIDAEGRYQFVNRMYETWFERPAREILGKLRNEILPPGLETLGNELQKKVLAGTPTRSDVPLLNRRTGGTHIFEAHFIPHLDRKSEKVVGTVVVGLDITENINALQAAEKLADDLQAAVQARDTFLSIASHELRTPITGMKLQTQIMRREIARDDLTAYPPERVAELVERTDRGLDRMNRLVEDMLDISRIQSGRLLLRPESADLAGIIRESIERYSASLAQARISISLDLTEGLIAQVDRFRMEQVFTNLITNSIRYASGGPLFVRLIQIPEGAEITFQDSGPGIVPEDRERVFHRFERLSSAKQAGGLGLGLYIVREIVRGHGGTIHVEGDEGKGARFVIRIPLSTASQQ